jgi:hypothetical protein
VQRQQAVRLGHLLVEVRAARLRAGWEAAARRPHLAQGSPGQHAAAHAQREARLYPTPSPHIPRPAPQVQARHHVRQGVQRLAHAAHVAQPPAAPAQATRQAQPPARLLGGLVGQRPPPRAARRGPCLSAASSGAGGTPAFQAPVPWRGPARPQCMRTKMTPPHCP